MTKKKDFLKFNYLKVGQKLFLFIKTKVKNSGFKKVIIALSSGIDSATCAFLAVNALGRKNVLITLLPYKKMNSTTSDTELVLKKLKIPKKNIFLKDISKIVDSYTNQKPKIPKLRKGNIMTRVRMMVLYDLAKEKKALVLGTENKSEHLLGYFTRFGDEASDIEPIRGLYKLQVKKLARFLGVPEKIIKKKPSADLWAGQTDEKELGFSYIEADPILFLYFDQGWSAKKILKAGFKKKVVEKVLKRAKDYEFKRKVPYLAKI